MEAEKGKYTYDYPRPAVTTDCVIFGYDIKEGLSVLLVERGSEPYKGCWAFPGGFLNMDETTEAGALRELKEETEFDVEKGFLEQLGCFSDVNRDPRGRVITIAYFALVRKGPVKGGDDAKNAQWFPLHHIPLLAFDHEEILRMAIRRLKESTYFRPIGMGLLPEEFTMSQLQDLYETILEVEFDRTNFATQMAEQGILEETNEDVEDAACGEVTLYRFNPGKYKEMGFKGFLLDLQTC